ncbi:hypothetical protein PV04_02162 [Phialophora macrospora]|uniref:Uncharacterized protein n=1 Tax=Phialophora macrospora TaxID=1851006 RepID=A0A0D2GCK3_9EURO|nr:hypothetical protein PV04_02162 [Phialophora macrospora]
MATQQASNHTRREIEAAETLVSFHNKTVEFVGLREVEDSRQLYPVTVPHPRAAAHLSDRRQMPPPPLPMSRQARHGQAPARRHGGQVYGQARAAPYPVRTPHLPQVPVLGQGAQHGSAQVQAPGGFVNYQYAAMAGAVRPPPSAPSPAPRQEPAPAAGPRARPGYSYRCYMCDHTIPHRLWAMVNHMVKKHGVTRESVDRTRLEDTKVQMLW